FSLRQSDAPPYPTNQSLPLEQTFGMPDLPGPHQFHAVPAESGPDNGQDDKRSDEESVQRDHQLARIGIPPTLDDHAQRPGDKGHEDQRDKDVANRRGDPVKSQK